MFVNHILFRAPRFPQGSAYLQVAYFCETSGSLAALGDEGNMYSRVLLVLDRVFHWIRSRATGSACPLKSHPLGDDLLRLTTPYIRLNKLTLSSSIR